MAIILEGKRDPEREAVRRITATVRNARAKHTGKRVSVMSQSERAELLEAIAMALGWADESGIVVES